MKKIYLFLILFFLLTNITCVWPENNSNVTVYYFHTSFRCASCLNIEKYTEETLKESFAEELENGELVYKVVNIEEKGNDHYAEDYELYTKSVVLSLVENGTEVKYKNLSEIWQKLRNKNKFQEYIKKEVQSFIDELEGEKAI